MKSQTPGFVHSSLRVFDLSLSEMLWSRRTIFMALVVGLPVLLSIIVRLLFELGAPTMRINQNAVTGPTIFGLMIWVFFIRFSVPVLGVFYGTSLIADEVDDKTITYLFTRPIPRGAVVLGKYLAYLLCVTSVVLPSAAVVFLVMVPFPDMAPLFGSFVRTLGVLALGLGAYGAVFLWAGTLFRRPLVGGLVFVFGWEQLAAVLPGYVGR